MKKGMIAVYFIIMIWTVMFILCKITDIGEILCGKGIHLISREYYRFITASFLHVNVIHLLANIAALYFVATYVDGKVSGWLVVVIGMIGGTIAEGIFAIIFSDMQSSVGGSGIVFAIIGFILVCQIIWKKTTPFQLGTWYGNWTLGYAILSNLFSPELGRAEVSTILFHGLAFVAGASCGMIYI